MMAIVNSVAISTGTIFRYGPSGSVQSYANQIAQLSIELHSNFHLIHSVLFNAADAACL